MGFGSLEVVPCVFFCSRLPWFLRWLGRRRPIVGAPTRKAATTTARTGVTIATMGGLLQLLPRSVLGLLTGQPVQAGPPKFRKFITHRKPRA